MPTRFDLSVHFLKELKPTDGVVIIYNDDADGMCSCVLVKKYLATKGVHPYIIPQPMPPDKNLMRRVQTGLPNKIIWLDMAIDQTPGVLQRMGSFANQLVVDHHIIQNDLGRMGGIIHHNPRFADPAKYQSTTYLAWKITSELMDTDNSLWIAAFGAVADYDLRWSEDLMEAASKKWPRETFTKLAYMVESVRLARALNTDQIVERLMSANSPDDILNDETFVNSYNSVQEAIDSSIEAAETKGQLMDKIFFYELESKFNIRSPVSGKLSEKWPNRVIVVYGKVGNNMNASVRSHTRKPDVNKILRAASRDIKGASAGGHEAAGGATVPQDNWEEFKIKLVEEANKEK